jgi:NADH-quinone oxidoreductase subunit N
MLPTTMIGLEIPTPHIEYGLLMPFLLVVVAACVGVLVEAIAPRQLRHSLQLLVAFLGIVLALFVTILNWAAGDKAVIALGALSIDGPTYFVWAILLVFAGISFLVFAERRLEGNASAFTPSAAAVPGSTGEQEAIAARLEHTEVYPLAMFALSGMMLFPAANDLIMMFVGLEVLSLPLYLLCGLARRRRLLSQEAALKYFMLGAFSSGFFLYGVALIYGFAGTMTLAGINEAVRSDTSNQALLLIGMGMLAVGLLFKVGAAPFQAWTPDVYQGAPTAVTGFMAACTKVAAFGALLRLFYVAFGADRWSWQPMMWVVAILTMLVGAIVACTQTDVKRMLAYSSIAHTGFLLTGLLGVQAAGALGENEITSLQAVLFYLATYGPATVGTFAIVTLVRDAGGEATALSKWAGLGRRAPLVAGSFGFLLLSMAGIPLTGGFVGKWAVFTVALSAGAWPVVVVAIVASIISVYFYVRVILLMFFNDAGDSPASVTVPSALTSLTIGVCVVLTLLLGVVPGPVLDLAGNAGSFIR